MPPGNTPDSKDPLEGCTHLAVVVRGAIIASIAAGLAIGTAVVVGGVVLFDAFGSPWQQSARGSHSDPTIATPPHQSTKTNTGTPIPDTR